MWGFFLDHWWVANAIPYFAFNLWLAHGYIADQEQRPLPFEEKKIFAILCLLGVWVTLTGWVLIYGHDLLQWMDTVAFRKEQLSWVRWRRYVKILRVVGRILAEFVMMTFLHLCFITITDEHPSRLVFYAEVIFLVALIEIPLRRFFWKRKYPHVR